MTRHIEYLKVEIRAWQYPGIPVEERIMDIRVNVNGQTYAAQHLLQPDDLESRFDLIFARAKAELLKAITDQQEQNRDQ